MTTRLHITPLTPDLLPSVLPASLQLVAEDVSFHQIVTFPENNYAYVTLPVMEADKMKKKLNGSILKGKKFKVETARPDTHEGNTEAEKGETKEKKKGEKKGSKKRKADHGVVEGYELPSDRKVKRGWTESTEAKEERRKEEKRKRKEEKKAKSQAKSKYTEKDECLFRTQLPPNKPGETQDKKSKASKKHKSATEPVVVHEFANTVSHPSFLRSGTEGTAPTSAFEQEKGWVDGEGHVKEPASERATKPDYRPGKVAGAKEKRKSRSKTKPVEDRSAEESDWTSSSGSDSESDSDESESGESTPAAKDTSPATSKDAEEKEEEDAPEDKKQPSNDVHPLEAVFKRSGPDQPSANPDFSFFDADDIESDDEPPMTLAEPQTPFTAQDIQARGLRSAAPTPDTNHVGRTVKRSDSEDEMDVDGDDEDESVSTPVSKSVDETEFTRWFWENRGDNNRAWKRRRREAAKEERQRENRRKGMKGKS